MVKKEIIKQDFKKQLEYYILPLTTEQFENIKENITVEAKLSIPIEDEELKDINYTNILLIGTSKSPKIKELDLKPFIDEKYLKRRWYNVNNILKQQRTQKDIDNGVTREYMAQGICAPYDIFKQFIREIDIPKYFAIVYINKNLPYVKRYENACESFAY
jgi:hypothetical protein